MSSSALPLAAGHGPAGSHTTAPLRSLRLVMAAVGSRGDVQPMIALAQRARDRGHRPVLAAPVNFEPWIRQSGLEFAACGIDFQAYLATDPDLLTGHPLKVVRAFGQGARDLAADQLRELLGTCDGADALVWGGLTITAPMVAEWARIPCLGVFYSTCMLPSSRHPPPMIPWHGLPGWINRLFWKVGERVSEYTFGPTLHALRASLGLPKQSVQEQVFEGGERVIAADEKLFPSDTRWDPQRYLRSNFIYFNDTRALDADLERWLADGPAPIFAGFGSMIGRGPQRAARAFIDALAGSGRRCIIGSGWAQLDGMSLPAGWRVVGDVPHEKLFPKLALVVHHGGSGTTAAALRAGTPQVVLPLILDQYHHAHVLHRAGLAPRPVPMERVTPASLAAAIDQALQLPETPRRIIAQRLQASDAATTIMELVESRVGASRAVPVQDGLRAM